MSLATGIGGVIAAIGGAMTVAPFVFPRSFFGELGHGDGMGLIGMSMFGLVLIGVGGAIALIAVLVSARQSVRKPDDFSKGE